MRTPRLGQDPGSRRVLTALLVLSSAACFRSVNPNVDNIVCQSEKNCPDGYFCAIPGQPGGCKPKSAGVDGSPDQPVADAKGGDMGSPDSGASDIGGIPDGGIGQRPDTAEDPHAISQDVLSPLSEIGSPDNRTSDIGGIADGSIGRQPDGAEDLPPISPDLPFAQNDVRDSASPDLPMASEVRQDEPSRVPEIPDAPPDVAPDLPVDRPVDQVPCNGGCCTSADCPATAPVCSASNQCAKCTVDADCAGRSLTACNATTGACVQCTQSSQCGGATANCDTTTNKCVGCTQRSHCPGACQTCTNNACAAVRDADDPSGCAGTCDSNGECKGKRGQRCDVVSGGCITGTTCADNYCCDQACTAPCRACNLATHEGTCTAVSSGDPPSGHGSCGTDAQCRGSCSGRPDGQCSYPTTACGTPSCSGTSLVPGGHCGSGACTPDSAQDCDGGLVCSANACKISCALDTDCRSDYFCSASSCHLDAIALSTSYGDHVCAISSDHQIHCWGMNDQGQLGDGTVSGAWTTTPSTVSGIDNATAVVSGSSFSCALLSDGTVRCWGLNSMAEMGIGDTTSPYKTSPVTPVGLSNVIALAASTGTVCAVEQAGTVKCWGYNGGGLILGSSNFMESMPVQVSGVTGAKAIAVGMAHVCILTTDGTPKCWGGNYKLQAGAPESMSTVTSPRTADGTGSGYTGVTAGNGHTCVLKGGTATCWGDNAFGQLGNNTVLTPQPPAVLSQISGITVISATADSTCALLSNKNVWCWGNVMSDDSTGATVYPAQVNVSQAQGVAGGYQSCAILANGSVSCWGWRVDSSPPGHLPPSSPVPAVGW
jgi:hypothetical protein